jgi:hypothetical protein
MNSRSAKDLVTKSAALLFAGLALICVVQAQDPEPPLSKDRPLVEIDLHRFGYDTSSATSRLQKFVDFTDASHFAVAWLTLDDPSDGKIGPLSKKPAHLHVLVLDAKTGEKIASQAWSTPSRVRFLGGRDGQFLICAGNLLRLFSPSFEVIRERELLNERACQSSHPWDARWGISPSRKSLLLSFPSQAGYQDTLLDVETFSVAADWAEVHMIWSISDHWLAAPCGQKQQICIRGIDKPWRLFQPDGLDKPMDSDWPYNSLFVSDTALAMKPGSNLRVMTLGGTQLFQVELTKNRTFDAAVPSVGGERFALIENKNRGSNNAALDMYFFSNDRAVVYSIAERRAIYAVKIKGDSLWTPWKTHRNTLAVSPDGSLLAVLDGASLKVYRLPDNILAH